MNRESISAGFILGCFFLFSTIQYMVEYAQTGQFYAPKTGGPVSGFLAILLLLSFLFVSIILLSYSISQSIKYKKREQTDSEGKSLELAKGYKLTKADILRNVLIALLLYFGAVLISKYV